MREKIKYFAIYVIVVLLTMLIIQIIIHVNKKIVFFAFHSEQFKTPFHRKIIDEQAKAISESKRLYEKGLGDFLKNNLIESEDYFNQSLKLNPNNFDSMFYLSKIYFKQKKYNQAKRLLQIIINSNPNYVDAFQLLAQVYLAEDKTQDAIKYYKIALEKQPSNIISRKALAKLKTENKEYKEALEHFKNILEFHPYDSETKNQIIFLKPYVNPSIQTFIGGSQEREADLILKIKTVQTNYLIANAQVNYPFNDRFSLFTAFDYINEKQRNLTAHLNNYNINNYFCSLTGNINIDKNWELKIKLLEKISRNKFSTNSNIFSFRNNEIFEPELLLKFSNPYIFFMIRENKDSFVGKNGLNVFSYLVKRIQTTILSEFYLQKVYSKIGGEIYVGQYYDKTDDNNKKSGSLWYKLERSISKYRCAFIYRFDYREMRKRTPDYFSYKNYKENILNLSLVIPWESHNSFDISYEYTWNNFTDLTNESRVITIDTINDPQVIPKHYYKANILKANLKLVYKTFLHFDLSGLLYSNTDKYNVWGIKGKINWVF